VKTCPACRFQNEGRVAVCARCGQALTGRDGLLPAGSVVAQRYELLAGLGKGGMGAVYKARDMALDEIVALKVLAGGVVARAVVARRFRSEIKLARRITHPNVCRIHEFGEDRGLRFIAMEFVEGVTLRSLLTASGAPPLLDGLDIAIQMAAGLEAIHAAGIIHRDLNTSNVMRNARGLVKIMDLGIAKPLVPAWDEDEITGEGVIVGTPAYMSPEQATGHPLDARSDIYAFGVVAFELFTAERLFRGETTMDTILKHVQEVPRLDRLPKAVRPVLAKALAKRPTDRFATAREMAQALQAARTSLLRAGASPSLAASLSSWLQAARKAVIRASAPSPEPWPLPEPLEQPSAPAGDIPVSDEGTKDLAVGGGPGGAAMARRPPPLAELTGLTRAINLGSEAREEDFLRRSRLAEPEFAKVDVFLCYRRGDSEDISGRIYDRLIAALGPDAVFKDVDSIPPGANFKKFLENVVQRCLVQLVVIGRNWLDVSDDTGNRRLDDPADWVRIEIEAALQRDIPVIPLLVHGAAMPREGQLPATMAELAYLQGASVRRDPDFHVDIDRLIAAIQKCLPRPRGGKPR
jgi:hypothetical protein